MRKLTVGLCFFGLIAGTATAKPELDSKQGVRALAAVADVNSLARGSVFSVIGKDLAAAGDPTVATVPYPQELAGAKVTVAVKDGSASWDAYLISVSSGGITAILPSAIPAGDYSVTVAFGGESSAPFAVKVVEVNFGFVTNTGGANGTVEGRLFPADGDPAAVTFVNSAYPGATLEFSASGLGPLDGADNESPPEANRYEGVVLVAGDVEIPVVYIGRDPARPGFDKVRVTLPESGLPSGCIVSFRLKSDALTAPIFSVPLIKEKGTICVHPLGYSSEAVETLSRGGSIVQGGMSTYGQTAFISVPGFSLEQQNAGFAGGFVRFTAAQVAAMAAAAQVVNGLDAGGCVVYDAIQGDQAGEYVDAGPKLVMTFPGGRAVDAPRVTGNVYVYTFPSFADMVPGVYGLSGAGGEVVGAFATDLNISERFTWTNPTVVGTSVNRNADLVFTWTGGNPVDQAEINGTANGPAPEDPSKIVTRILRCTTKIAEGKLTVPSEALKKMPVIPEVTFTGPGGARSLTLALSQANSASTIRTFSAPLVTGGSTASAAWVFGWGYIKSPLAIP